MNIFPQTFFYTLQMKYIDFFGDLIETTINDHPVWKFINKEIYIAGNSVITPLHMKTIDHYYLISLLTDYSVTFASDDTNIPCQYYTFGSISDKYIFDVIPIPTYSSLSDSIKYGNKAVRDGRLTAWIDTIGDRELTEEDEYTIRAIAQHYFDDFREWYEANKNKEIEYKNFDALWAHGPFLTKSVAICDRINIPLSRFFYKTML